MKQLLFVLLLAVSFCNSIFAEEIDYRERVYVYTDKDCYLPGEDMWIKFVVYDNTYQLSGVSKVGYIELADTVKPYVRLPLALENGVGSISVRIPRNIEGGVYRLNGYTRFMRNEGEEAFFTKDLVVVNPNRAGNNMEALTIRINEPGEPTLPVLPSLMTVKKRSLASIRLTGIPDDLIDATISVTRKDIVTKGLHESKPVVFRNKPLPNLQWTPEYEGHIVTGRSNSEDKSLLSNVSVVGNSFCFFSGKPHDSQDLIEFFTYSVYGRQDMIISLNSQFQNSTGRSKPEIISPFVDIAPQILTPAEIATDEQSFMERYMSVQLNAMPKEKRSYNDPDIYAHNRINSYNMDEYAQFPTLGESILEFVHDVKVSTINRKKQISVYLPEEKVYNNGNTLVLLDGVPISNHEQALAYNPRFLEYLKVYNGNYVFGGHLFTAIFSLITYEQTLPHFILDDLSDLLEYTFPLLPETFDMPDYSDAQQKASQLPDFRTTLYWQPYLTTESIPEEISFYTSDLAGKYCVSIEGITSTGNSYKKELYFSVE